MINPGDRQSMPNPERATSAREDAGTIPNALPGMILAIILLAPFAGKAFTIDDTVFLFESIHVLKDPLHPTAFDFPWGDDVERVSRIVPTGPLMAWILVPAILADGSEIIAHLTQLLFVLLAILATVSIALRTGMPRRAAVLAGLLLAATPALLGMAGTAMPDVPSMALGVAGLERLLAWRSSLRRRDGLLSALLLGFAVLGRTHLLALLAIGSALAFLPLPFLVGQGAARPRLWWWPVGGALLVVAIGTFATRDPSPEGAGIVGVLVALSSSAKVASNLAAFGLHWLLPLPFALPWLALRRWPSRWLLLTGLGIALLLASALWRSYGWEAALVVGGFSAIGILAVLDATWDGVARRDAVQALLGAWLLVALPAVAYTHFPSKYLLASAPAAALLVALLASRSGRAGLVAASLAIAGGSGLGVAILRADSAFAGHGRDAVAAFVPEGIAAGRRVWYVGHWGFQWYAERAGARFLVPRDGILAPGDLIVSAARSEPHLAVERMPFLVHRARRTLSGPAGRIMDVEAGAGFYSTSWGWMPWAWGSGIHEAIDLWEVTDGR